MLLVYGPYLPVRILEEIRFWKQQEAEHTDVIKAIVPGLEPYYVQLLNDWKRVFEETTLAANQLLQYATSSQHAACDPKLIHETEKLLNTAFRQSHEFVRQLYTILDCSHAVKAVPLAKTVLLHIIRESEYFLGVLETLNSPGAIKRNSEQFPSTPDLQQIAGDPHQLLGNGFPDSSPDLSDFGPDFDSKPRTEPWSESWSEPELKIAAYEEDTTINDNRDKDDAVPIGGHTLPPLPYPYNALEPHIDEKTVRIHHDIHHKSYVDNLNKAEKKLQEARKSGNFDLIKHWERELAFNGAGHYLHTIYWDTMNPKGGGKPQGELAEQIRKDFGSYEAFKNQFTNAADKVEGGGWAILVWSPRSHRLEILMAEKHQNLSQWDVVPLLALDVWEHSYYLKHQNERGK
ncbi:Superoxide dismutase [Mn/Fe] [compost metagenome]